MSLPFRALALCFGAAIAHALSMHEQPPDWYWDLTQAAWVRGEQAEQHDEDEPAEAEQEQER